MESISSGMNYLKRRFSSQDLADEEKPTPTQAQHSSVQSGPPTVIPFSLAGLANKVSSTISAPTSPARSQQSMYSQVQGLTKNLMNAATSSLSSAVPHGPHKCILIIDDHHIDWSKYFRNNRTGLQLRIEQASFRELHLCCYPNTECVVEIFVPGREPRSFRPDFVMIRQVANSERGDYTNVVAALLKSGVATLNGPKTTCEFLNKNLMFSSLRKLAHATGPNALHFIERIYYPSFRHFNEISHFPLVVTVGHAIHGFNKIKVDNKQQLWDLEGILRCRESVEVTTEPFIDAKYDIHLQKIGEETKAFIRRSISGNWKSNMGSAMLEQVALTSRHKHWIKCISDAFNGMEIMSIDIIVSKDGGEVIYDVNDVITLFGESQEEDRRSVTWLIQSYLIKTATSENIDMSDIDTNDSTSVMTKLHAHRPNTADRSVNSGIAGPTNGAIHVRTSPIENRSNGPPPRPIRQPSVKERDVAAAQDGQHQGDDTMGQLKRTFAGIFGDVS
ncbi:hypothetical protein AB6A40_000005 [Gnathostoma spinigerum]|uniref:Synapsin n=1 Tax=Gnathostoma spinigerum TaxID=75299 RepID=A0ABD6E2H0_9BILA